MERVIVRLRALNGEQVREWRKHFSGVEDVAADEGDIFGATADAVVSPANSFGDMTGGIDRLYRRRFGDDIQTRLQAILRAEYGGELLVGQAVLVETGAADIPWMISAPTMRVPLDVSKTVNAYLAFRAVLRLVSETNGRRPGAIRSVLCPGLGTGTGEMPASVCAKQMRAAYDEVVGGRPRVFATLNDAMVEHYRLMREGD
jgi:O-acetyl-ADP-ribose deacetylase (regulator of RNase III)